jgi:antitoxin YefM
MKVMGFTEARANLARTLDAVVDDAEEVVIHRPHDRSVVMVSLTDWNAMQETAHLLSTPANAARLRQAMAGMDGPAPEIIETTADDLAEMEQQ